VAADDNTRFAGTAACLVRTAFDTCSLLTVAFVAAKHHDDGGDWSRHQRLFTEGFVALVECDPRRSGMPSGSGLMKPDQAYRTGRLAHLKRDAFARVFNVPVAAEQPCVFVEPGVIEQLQAMVLATD
jgi:hypothetical protein